MRRGRGTDRLAGEYDDDNGSGSSGGGGSSYISSGTAGMGMWGVGRRRHGILFAKLSNRFLGGMANARYRAHFRRFHAIEFHRVGGQNRGTRLQSQKLGKPYGKLQPSPMNFLPLPQDEIFSLVSWVRHRDVHLLTVGRYTYTSDQRFEAQHYPHTEDWTLKIRYPQRKDTGIYECQISTTPPVGRTVHLTIVEPVTIIVGQPDLFVNKGSTINLTCIVRYAPEPPPMMVWSHNTEIINFDSPRGGISLVTEKGPETTSRLMIQKAVPSDSGIYTCEPSNANPSSIKVHVVDGKCFLCRYISAEHSNPSVHDRFHEECSLDHAIERYWYHNKACSTSKSKRSSYHSIHIEDRSPQPSQTGQTQYKTFLR
ncbi:hypothetical protein M0804_008622 [Polistes exclamans]|nr:hypothetical protein M0804_008622 [Polistes exclamans]